jgi:hypothetical protein
LSGGPEIEERWGLSVEYAHAMYTTYSFKDGVRSVIDAELSF